ncbi:hypothetical protein [uncultured Clostridium sp.]|uniref:hypothetical protein n=1 Tax=uncultured Clostridium sp. TaxID=59620 RepID=UPI002623DB1A|nr:hypothetical protein [uncultured Clostridium sp.]
MKELMFNDGDITFIVSETIEGFENKLVNSLQIFSCETFYDQNNGINFDVISSNQTDYKLEHIKSKLLEWYGNEIEDLKYKNIKLVNKVVKATLEYSHKTLGNKESEVNF